MKPSRVVPGLLALVLVVATISVAFPITVPEEYAGETEYAQEPVQVEGGEIDANATELWVWTQRALNRNVNVTPTIRIRDFEGTIADGAAMPTEATAFQRLLVYDDPDDEPPGGVLAFVTAGSPDVNVNRDRLPAVKNGSYGRTVEGLLVHEYTHVVQFQSEAVARSQPSLLSATSDDTLAYQATIEGGAEFVADDYTDDSAVERVRARWNDPRTSAAARLGQWPYYRGLVYLDERFAGPSDLWEIYENPPASTAAILRGEAGGDGPPNRSLDLELADYHSEVDDRPGAAFAEVALSKEVDPERARDVATGWRWGALKSIQPDRDTDADRSLRHVWVTEWQSEAEADAFETAMTEYLDSRWGTENGTWSAQGGPSFALERVDENSLAVLAGPDAFLADATVTVEGDEYVIDSAGGTAASTSASASTASIAPSGPLAGNAPTASATSDPATAGI